MNISHINYRGWENSIQLVHGALKLVVTSAVGPRIIHCGFTDSENMFYEHPLQAGTSGGNEWKTYGGHRLWCAPEDKEFTYAPDNFEVAVEEYPDHVSFTAPVEKCGVQKTISIHPIDGNNGFRIVHLVSNRGSASLRLAPWALTVMRAGGMAVIPLNLDKPRQLLPTHTISLWGYTNMSDPRWQWGERYVFLKQDPAARSPQKFGLQNPYEWVAYALNEQLFIKRFDWKPEAVYPDFNVNFEAYTDKDILELETLAPLVELKPGDMVSHGEEWYLFRHVPLPRSEKDVDRQILPIVNK